MPFYEVDPNQFSRKWLDVAYAHEDPRQTMDIWLPEEGEGPHPLIVFVHGGGWISGYKRENTMPGIFKIMSQGYAVACIEYRLAPAAHWPEPLEDVRAAIRYLRAYGAEYNLKTDRIGATGNSAGGHLLNMVAALAGRPIMQGSHLGNADQSDAIQCMFNLYSPSDFYQLDLCDRSSAAEQAEATAGATAGATDGMGKPHNMLLGFPAIDFPDAAQAASPLAFVTQDFPPTWLLHGIADQLVPYTQTVALRNKVNRICGEERVHMQLFPDALHGAEAMKTDEVINHMVDFFDEYLWEGAHQRPPLAPADVKVLQ